LLGMKLLMSTAFHLQMDGATERANWSIGQLNAQWLSLCSIVVAVLLWALHPSSWAADICQCLGEILASLLPSRE
jgi:hypothetical protein